MSVVNKPKVSRVIATTYEVFAVFIFVMTAFFAYLALFTPMSIIAGLAASSVSAFVGVSDYINIGVSLPNSLCYN
jgi:Sec-independent protein secretion pathway component TatC